MTEQPIISDVPLGMPKETNPAREACQKEITTQVELAKTDPFYEINSKTYPCTYDGFRATDDEGNPKDFRPALAAKWISENEQFKTDYKTGILYFYDGKCWIPNAEPYLEKILTKILGDQNRQSHYNNILHDLKGLTYTNIEFSTKIACGNGLLDVETQELTAFNEIEMSFHKIPVKYDPEAKCPSWEEFIKEVVNADDIPTIQEWSGFLLLPDYRFHKLLWVQGEGRNGKGVWQRTMEAILGEENVSNVGLEEFDGEHRFAMANLYGKLFNPCSEPKANTELQTNLLKYATGQDTITAEIKRKQKRVRFRNYAKITVLANRFPKISDQTTAFRERRLFIKFPNEFIGKDCIANVEQNWLTINDEKSGILNWMLEGLKRLLLNGCFSESKTQVETEAQFLRASDTIGAFIKEMLIFDKNRVTSRSEALEAYKNYCDILGLYVVKEQKFTERLKETPKINVGVIKKPKQERAWRGIGLKKIDEEGKITELETLELVTKVTQVTPLYTQPNTVQSQEKNKIEYRGVTSVTSVTQKEEKGIDYQPLTCVFCNERITDDKWTSDDFTWGKPAHRQCYDSHKAQLSENEREFTDDNPRSEEA